MFGIGMPEMVVIIVVALVVLGPKRLPEVARALGKGLAEFRKVTGEVNRELEAARSMIEAEAREHEAARRRIEREARLKAAGEAPSATVAAAAIEVAATPPVQTVQAESPVQPSTIAQPVEGAPASHSEAAPPPPSAPVARETKA